MYKCLCRWPGRRFSEFWSPVEEDGGTSMQKRAVGGSLRAPEPVGSARTGF